MVWVQKSYSWLGEREIKRIFYMDECDGVKMMGYELGIGSTLIGALDLASMLVIAEERLKQKVSSTEHEISPEVEPGLFVRLLSLFLAKRTIWWIYTRLAGKSTVVLFNFVRGFFDSHAWFFLHFLLCCCLEDLGKQCQDLTWVSCYYFVFHELIFLLLG